jgi:putative endonuclease
MQFGVPAQAGPISPAIDWLHDGSLPSQGSGEEENLLFGPAQAWIQVPVRTMPFVYLLASKPYGTLYVGSTFELARRVWQHKTRAIPGFTARYGVDRLVWFETHEHLETALVRERQIKKWKRDWKINLSERDNPHWADLYPSLSP